MENVTGHDAAGCSPAMHALVNQVRTTVRSGDGADAIARGVAESCGRSSTAAISSCLRSARRIPTRTGST